MQIKKMPEAERPQEKMLYGGPGCLSNSELLALIIRSGTDNKSLWSVTKGATKEAIIARTAVARMVITEALHRQTSQC